ncbi:MULTISPECIES: MOSC domain-containing protein [unclassified Vibrio]|uniref:MOSC domain-containing protein n=1 Tax=unclassified Vibrio TaxID=2614977 RepID=UPI001361A777|nr:MULTISPECIES: MOSC domain-containing protein [unclassified Vibrio]NAW58571.1 MOSC domain-containing protein [Vibrio sp. V36_P2S2PM302]NAX21399.1 MOSC domain-containing protein [Vibrio sp. V39_P1S14PM300]NAX27455.1 MOSC domain-containing protein [Vibrio sp. V38_P2S17PM301]NAX32397.1 MOSC domain-containing protein [Vibrio sp. V37_P2S8PM304]
MTTFYLTGVYRGQVKQSYGMTTAMDKQPVSEEVFLTTTGIEGDECAETRFHGGSERALHQYPSEHYAYWQSKYKTDDQWRAPGMGENLSSEGMTEKTVYIGDRYRWGGAIIEVSQPRSPCYKLSKRWGVEQFSVDMQAVSRCGWLYRVIQPGRVSVNAPLELIERPENAMSIRQVCELYFGDPLNPQGLEKLLAQSALSHSWKEKILSRIETGEVENWNFRLLGHAG